MTGDDLLALAGHLIANSAFGIAKARYRSAVSRAYYGAFHLSVSMLEDVAEFHVLENHTGHDQVCRVLRGTGVSAAVAVANALNELRSIRNRADYKLKHAGFQSRPRAQEWVEEAWRVRSWLENCRDEPARSEIQQALQP